MQSVMIVARLGTRGAGRRALHDQLFAGDKPPARLGVYDLDEEDLSHEFAPSACHVAGCLFASGSLLEHEEHYNARHRYACSRCKKSLPSPHLLDLHLLEDHDSFFAVLAAKKPSYRCYIEECQEKFMLPEERFDHCVRIHKLPKDFRFHQKPKTTKCKKNKSGASMDVDVAASRPREKTFTLSNSKQKAFLKSCRRRSPSDSDRGEMNVDDAAGAEGRT